MTMFKLASKCCSTGSAGRPCLAGAIVLFHLSAMSSGPGCSFRSTIDEKASRRRVDATTWVDNYVGALQMPPPGLIVSKRDNYVGALIMLQPPVLTVLVWDNYDGLL